MQASKDSSDSRFPVKNRLLRALSQDDLCHFRPHLESGTLRQGGLLYEAGEPLQRVYFIEKGIVSIVAVFRDGSCAEMATVGWEGIVPVSATLGGESAIGRHEVQMSGSALIMEIGRFREALRARPRFRAMCEASSQAFLSQTLQNVACNAAHAVERRCARWLLMSHDRTAGDVISLTQEYLAEMLGVRRQTVTAAARALQRAGLIRYHRGVITVLDRARLEAAACECYQLIRARYEQLLPSPFG